MAQDSHPRSVIIPPHTSNGPTIPRKVKHPVQYVGYYLPTPVLRQTATAPPPRSVDKYQIPPWRGQVRLPPPIQPQGALVVENANAVDYISNIEVESTTTDLVLPAKDLVYSDAIIDSPPSSNANASIGAKSSTTGRVTPPDDEPEAIRPGAVILEDRAKKFADFLVADEDEKVVAAEKKTLQNRAKRLKEKRKALEKKSTSALDESMAMLAEDEVKLGKAKAKLKEKGDAILARKLNLAQDVERLNDELILTSVFLESQVKREYTAEYLKVAGNRREQLEIAAEMLSEVAKVKKEYGFEE